jgi:hypothetical protein
MPCINFLDLNFYETIPTWVYITGGFSILIIINSTVLCCYCCKVKKLEKRKKELDLLEYKLRQCEIQVNRKIEKEKEYDDIILSYPIKYSEFSKKHNL